MARAIQLARLGLYTTDPNPRVGCVLARDAKTVGEGWHRKAGEPHAERNAITDAGEAAKDATAYVTLEPCCHTGRTPPCTEGLIEAGVSRVVVAMTDPNPSVAGEGIEQLRQAGIQVEQGLMQAEAEALNPGFIKRMQQGLPYVRCKLATSLDGRTAMASGESVWITDDAARRDVQLLRARSSAVVTGSGTVQADDPSMNVRVSTDELPGVEESSYLRQPLRVILDSALKTTPSARIVQQSGNVLILHAEATAERKAALHKAGFQLEQVTGSESGLELESALKYLASREINEVLIEAGPTLAGAALQAGIVDELVIYMAPHLMGHEGLPLFYLPGMEKMADRINLQIRDIRQVGRDIRITAVPQQS